eukprot:s425_g4.t2
MTWVIGAELPDGHGGRQPWVILKLVIIEHERPAEEEEEEKVVSVSSGELSALHLLGSYRTGRDLLSHLIPIRLEDLWMSSASVSSQKFLKEFSPKREALNEYLRFMPHYHVFSMDGSKDYKELCFDVSGKYCAEDPDGSGSVTGYVVLLEDVRQLCIHELYTKSMDERISYQQHPTSESALYAAEWWRYASNYLDECPLDGKAENAKFGPTCSVRVMKKFGIDVEKVEACVAQTQDQKLQQQLTFTAWSPRALRINGWRYKGQLDGDLVTRAICSGFVETPQKCKALIEPRNPFLPFAQSKETGVSFSQMVEAIVATALFGICIMYFYKRALTRHVHTALREEVMLEVQTTGILSSERCSHDLQKKTRRRGCFGSAARACRAGRLEGHDVGPARRSLRAVLAQLSQGKVEDVVTDRGLGAKSHHTHQEIAKAGDWDESFRRLG